jgi:hypothetical protein
MTAAGSKRPRKLVAGRRGDKRNNAARHPPALRRSEALAYPAAVSGLRQRQTKVVDLRAARERKRLSEWRSKLARVMASNQRTIGRLYATGVLFSGQGAKMGRDLLLAHQHLLKMDALLDRLSEQGARRAPPTPRQTQALYLELDALLDRAGALTHRSGALLSGLRRE